MSEKSETGVGAADATPNAPANGIVAVALEGLTTIRAIAIAAMEGSDPQQRIGVLLIVAIVVIGVLASVGLAWNAPNYAFAILLADLILFGILTIPLLGLARRIALEPGSNLRPAWQRSAVKWPPSSEEVEKLSEQLSGIRLEAHKYLCDNFSQERIQKEQVRANVFVPNCGAIAQNHGAWCSLWMPEQLRSEMNFPKEWLLRFNPGQGLTGNVFVNGHVRIARRMTRKEGDWDTIFELTDELKDQVHPNLRWILSFPIHDPKGRDILAVLNIDGLNHDIPDEILGKLATFLSSKVSAFGARLSLCPRLHVFVCLDGVAA